MDPRRMPKKIERKERLVKIFIHTYFSHLHNETDCSEIRRPMTKYNGVFALHRPESLQYHS